MLFGSRRRGRREDRDLRWLDPALGWPRAVSRAKAKRRMRRLERQEGRAQARSWTRPY